MSYPKKYTPSQLMNLAHSDHTDNLLAHLKRQEKAQREMESWLLSRLWRHPKKCVYIAQDDRGKSLARFLPHAFILRPVSPLPLLGIRADGRRLILLGNTAFAYGPTGAPLGEQKFLEIHQKDMAAVVKACHVLLKRHNL